MYKNPRRLRFGKLAALVSGAHKSRYYVTEKTGKRNSWNKEEGEKSGTNCPDHTASTFEGSDIQGEWGTESVESGIQDAGFGRSPRIGNMYLDRKRSIHTGVRVTAQASAHSNTLASSRNSESITSEPHSGPEQSIRREKESQGWLSLIKQCLWIVKVLVDWNGCNDQRLIIHVIHALWSKSGQMESIDKGILGFLHEATDGGFTVLEELSGFDRSPVAQTGLCGGGKWLSSKYSCL